MNNTHGYIYLLCCEGFFKIGRSRNHPTKRLAQLQTGSPFEVTLIHAIRCDDPVWVEGLLHRRFDGKRYKGEWFELDGADVRQFLTLNGNGLTPDEQSALEARRQPSAWQSSIIDRLNGKSTESLAEYLNRQCHQDGGAFNVARPESRWAN